MKILLGLLQILTKTVTMATILHRSKYQFVFSPLDWEFEIVHWWEGDVRSELGLVKGLIDSNTMPGVRMVMVPFTDISLSSWNSFLCGLLHYNLHHSQIAFMILADLKGYCPEQHLNSVLEDNFVHNLVECILRPRHTYAEK